MIRNESLTEISDGRLYGSRDLVRADTLGCKGCSACCHEVDDTIVLDPYDLWQLKKAGEGDFADLMANGRIELGVVDGLIQPHLMVKKDSGCSFLSPEGRCTVHDFRPGFCRMFPLGRYYHDGTFSYIIQKDQCRQSHRAKIRVDRWLGIPDLKKYEEYILTWHTYLRELHRYLTGHGDEQRDLSMNLLTMFFTQPYDPEDFYGDFSRRMVRAGKPGA